MFKQTKEYKNIDSAQKNTKWRLPEIHKRVNITRRDVLQNLSDTTLKEINQNIYKEINENEKEVPGTNNQRNRRKSEEQENRSILRSNLDTKDDRKLPSKMQRRAY